MSSAFAGAESVPRFRFAPSPTGEPHVGSLHTALFSWGLARALGGDFILRIDDTDAARNTAAAEQEMIDALQWLGIDWDEGPDLGGPFAPYYQSQRRQRHREVAASLLESGHAYYDKSPAAAAPAEGAPLRLRLPDDGQTVVHDALRGPIPFANDKLDDPIILRSDGAPLYHLANVVDDHDMEISHVVRGADWIATAPIHVHLYRALGWQQPVWIHLPLIRNAQGEKLSKRDPQGGYLMRDFQEAGYLPEALFNYLLLLGWSPPGGEEILGKWEVRQQLSIDRLSTSPAIFDWQKLNWLNRQYLQRKSDEAFLALIRPYLDEAYGLSRVNEAWLLRLTATIREEVVRLADAVPLADWAFSDSFPFTEAAEAALESEAAHPVLVRLVAEMAQLVLLDEPTAGSILQNLRQSFAQQQWTARQIYWPIRAALTGSVEGPPLAEVMALLGKQRCMARIADILR